MVMATGNSDDFPRPPSPAVSRGTRDSWLKTWRFGLFLVLLVFAAYQPVWRAGFIWDDHGHLTRPELRSATGLGKIWTDVEATQQYYPLTHTAFWVMFRFFGLNPLGYHLVNVALHAANAVLVLLLLRRLAIPGAALAAAVFALHPVMVESVAWVSELKNTLSGLFYLTAALVYLRFDQSRQGRWYALALGLFVLGLVSKTVTASLPAALLVVFWWQRGRLTWQGDVRPLLPFFGLGAAAGLTTAWVEHALIGATGADYGFSVLERSLIAGRVVWFYLGKLLWPAGLVFIYPRWEISATDPWQYAYPLVAGVALIIAWQARHRSRAPLAALLFFGGTLFPGLGFINVYPFRYSFVADHFQYLASLGILTLTGAALTTMARHRGWPGRWLGAGLLLVLAVLTWRQCGMYVNPVTLWVTTIARNPGSWLAHNNLGNLFYQAGNIPLSLRHYEIALRCKPDYAPAHYNLGVAAERAGRLDEARDRYETALRCDPTFAEAHLSLGNFDLRAGRVDAALAHYTEAARLQPHLADRHSRVGALLTQMGRAREALPHYAKALQLEPQHAFAHYGLGMALVQSGELDAARRHATETLRLHPHVAAAHFTLGLVQDRSGNLPDAIRHFEDAVRLDPTSVEAHYQLGLALEKANRFAEAIPHLERARQLETLRSRPPNR